jgi:RNA polymerase sigma-70 factor (ECF subfamily)
VAQAQRGDPAAREELVRRVLPTLRAFVRRNAGRKLREREEISDLVQSTCRELLERLAGFEFRGDAAFGLWVIQTARHKILERARYWGRAKRAADEVELPPIDSLDPEVAGDLLAACSSHATPAREAIVREDQRRVLTALAAMSEDQRRVIVLHRLAGFAHKEIARELGKSEGAVRQLLFRAMNRLAKLLGEAGPRAS